MTAPIHVRWPAALAALAMLLTVSAAPSCAQAADAVLWYDQDAWNGANGLTQLTTAMTGAGATAVDAQTTWPASLDDYRVAFVVLPSTALDAGQTADLADFLDGGGLLVTIGDAYSGFATEDDNLELLLADLGIGSGYDALSEDANCGHAGYSVGNNPLIAGVSAPEYAWTNSVVPGPAADDLVYGEADQLLLSYDSGVVLAVDVDMFTDSCGLPADNETLFANLFTAWCDMDGDGLDKPICGGVDCDDDDAAVGGPTAWYQDADGDGFGNPAVSMAACSAPADYVADNTDCDDADVNAYPGAAELHDGADNDCDDLYDEGVLPADALVITEIMKNPAAVNDNSGEWFELFNNTAVDMNLIGLEVTDLGSNAFTVLTNVWITAGDYAVLGLDADPAANGGVTLDYEYTSFQLGNNGDDEIILTHDGVMLDTVIFDDAPWPDTSGAALSLDPLSYDPTLNDDPAYWCDAQLAYGDGDLGTPGMLNTPCCPDADGDGFLDAACGGTDCDDSDAAVNPDASEMTCDQVDNDCDPATVDSPDGDGDGVGVCDDCDDGDSGIYPGNAETPCDQMDNDCDPNTLDNPDGDGDGFGACDECDDADPAVNPNAAEVPCDMIDNDCDPATFDNPDGDGDGWGVCTDCDDNDPAVNVDASEVTCDQIDNDCDPATEDNPDGDGDGFGVCNDCDDADAAVNPDAAEVQCDQIDNDCDPATEDSPDGDGDGDGVCTDCDDADAAVYTGAAEAHDGIDNDCDGLYDEGALPADALVITEIMRNPDAFADSDAEWFELFNNTGIAINLIGALVYDLGSDDFTVESDLWIPAGEHAVLGRNDDVAANGGVTLDYLYASDMSLANGEDELFVELDGTVLDSIPTFDDVSWPSTAGHSMSLDPMAYDPTLNDDPANWCDAPTQWAGADYGSPGEENPSCCEDADGDGYGDVACGGLDCDDADDTIHPDAAEIECDGIDNDCDEATADSPDGDGDGDGACTDCDDEDATTYTDAPEQCDQIDNDCDGEVDEDVDEDLDGDGVNACQGDCDNENPDTYPDADEICDGEDNDCDGDVPADEVDDDGDGWLVCDGDCDDADADLNLDDADGDGFTTCGDGAADGDCDDGEDTVYPGATEDCADGMDNDCDGLVDADDTDDCAGGDDDDDDMTGDDDDDDDDTGGTDCDCQNNVGRTAPVSPLALIAGLLGLVALRRRAAR